MYMNIFDPKSADCLKTAGNISQNTVITKSIGTYPYFPIMRFPIKLYISFPYLDLIDRYFNAPANITVCKYFP